MKLLPDYFGVAAMKTRQEIKSLPPLDTELVARAEDMAALLFRSRFTFKERAKRGDVVLPAIKHGKDGWFSSSEWKIGMYGGTIMTIGRTVEYLQAKVTERVNVAPCNIKLGVTVAYDEFVVAHTDSPRKISENYHPDEVRDEHQLQILTEAALMASGVLIDIDMCPNDLQGILL